LEPRLRNPVSDDDSASLVAESYLSEYHIHRQKTVDRTLTDSDFQVRLTKFAEEITKLGTIKKLVQIVNGIWILPLECAMRAVNDAGSAESESRFNVRYREFATDNDNHIELTPHQYFSTLQWHPEPQAHIPGSTFLNRICTEVFSLVKKIIIDFHIILIK
jgi:hypothetical protein